MIMQRDRLMAMGKGTILCGMLAVASLLSGCAFNGNSGSQGSGVAPTGVAHLNGKVFGGQQPVSGSTIQLYTVGTLGPGSTATPLISASVTTNSSGQFSITGDYSCASATEVYLVATGGDAGSGNNSALSMMAALGPCSSLSSSNFIVMNELTTVAAAFALAPFMSSYSAVGGTGTNPVGLVNAFNEAQMLVNTSTGTIASAPAGITLPVAKLNTLADTLAACVNTSGSSSSTCTALFNATGAADTAGAALAMAQSPGSSSTTALWSLGTTTPPFVPALSALPNDFTLAVNYAGAELAAPYGIAIDASGNAWVTNEAGSSAVKLPSLSTGFSTMTFGSAGLLAPRGISIDQTGNIWIANTGANNVVKLSSAGVLLSGSGYTNGGISGPVSIANDSGGNAWIANFLGGSVTELSSTGTASGVSPISTSLSAPSSVAIDNTGRVAVANQGSGALCLLSNAGVLQECANDGSLFGATAVAVSSGGSIVLTGSTTGASVSGAFTLATNTGTVNSSSPISGGGLTLPAGVAFDGNAVAWFSNASSISAFSGSSAITGITGFGSLSSPAGIAVDASGNVWTANTGDNSVTIFVGLATPVITPIAANVGP